MADPIVEMIHQLAADFPLDKEPTLGGVAMSRDEGLVLVEWSGGDRVRASVLACASDILNYIEEEIRNEADFHGEAASWRDILNVIPLPSLVRECLGQELQARAPRAVEDSDV